MNAVATTALFSRALLVRTRAGWAVPVRLGLGAALLLTIVQVKDGLRFASSPGYLLLGSTAVVMALALTFIGLGWFASAITDEKEEGTLELLVLTGITPLALLLAKGGARLWEMGLLLGLALPPLCLAVTLGGVSLVQVLAVFSALSTWLALLAGFGLVSSVTQRTTRAAAGMMLLLVIMILFFFGIFDGLTGSGLTVFGRLGQVLSTGYQGGILGWGDGVRLLLGAACLLCAWRMLPEELGRQLQDDGEEIPMGSAAPMPPGPGAGPEALAPLPPLPSPRPLPAARQGTGWRWLLPMDSRGRPPAGLAAVTWKDFHVHSHGSELRLSLLMIAAFLGLMIFPMAWQEGDLRRAVALTLLFAPLALVVPGVAVQLGQVMALEFRDRTIGDLRILPYATRRLFLAKLSGVVVMWWPHGVVMVAGLFLDLRLLAVLGGLLLRSWGWTLVGCVICLWSLTLFCSVVLERRAALLSLALCLVMLPFHPLNAVVFPVLACLLLLISYRRFCSQEAGA